MSKITNKTLLTSDFSTYNIDDIKFFQRCLQACVFHTQCIEEEQDKEIIEIHIEAIDEISKTIYENPIPVKTLIQYGMGDLKSIKDKCIQMGIVPPLKCKKEKLKSEKRKSSL